ncbi:polyadenylate-binding protein-interacting protein 4-like isoform X2 [Primulina huaijiensis]|uniref:polyadenylate-binding protein-interacting protein 4-like isoform X2 n=1 Tax=Primulina huaijiensis TaxID=1492673 RepID=UPI003CC702B9
MNNHQVPQPRSSCNGYGRRKSERDVATRFDDKFQAGKTNSSRINFGNGGGLELPPCDRLIYLSASLIGHQVEVQVLDGSIFSGIFHATNTDDFGMSKNHCSSLVNRAPFGIVLKMACLIKDGSQAQKNIADSPSKSPSRTLIIPGKDLVQLIAKGVSLTSDVSKNEFQHDKKQELMVDSCISQSRHVELGRELEPWIPDENDPGCPELDNVFDGPRNRGWDQFEANETLFGVKSTFNEELYTTKLARGPQLKELEREAARMAREIEGEETFDLHLAEERGIQLDGNFDIDEETRFSSVYRVVDDGGYDEIEDIFLDSQNDETFGIVSGSVIDKPQTNMSFLETNERAQFSSRSTLLRGVQSCKVAKSTGTHHSTSANNAQHLLAEQLPKESSEIDAFRLRGNHFIGSTDSYLYKDDKEHKLSDQSWSSKAEDLYSFPRLKKENYDKVGLSPNALAFDPSWSLSKGEENTSSTNELTDSVAPIKAQGTTIVVSRPGSSATSTGQEKTGSSDEPSEGFLPPKIRGTTTAVAQPSSSSSSTADHVVATSSSTGRGLSPSSSVGSFSSEKSSLNPHAKEFKFNPNAKSFIPTPTPLRISSPVSDSSFYYPANMTAVTHMHGMPIGIGLPSFASQQPVIFNPQAAVPQLQPYYHPNGPQYGQQMLIGQPRPVMFMPAYPQEMPYQGREF